MLLIIYSIQKRQLKQLFLFFILPLLMIGYPGIQKISYDNGVLSIEKYNKLLAESPKDTTLRNELEETIEKVENRPVTNTQTLVNLSKSHAILGDTLKAIDRLDDALKVDSNLKVASRMKQSFTTQGVKVDLLTKAVENNPENQQAKAQLEREITVLEQNPNLSETAMKRIVNSSAALGDTTKVLKYIDSVNVNTANERIKVNNLKTRFDTRRTN
jgi:tetratricopeptide (TPR) repeat protein